jgi:hypothetical protein
VGQASLAYAVLAEGAATRLEKAGSSGGETGAHELCGGAEDTRGIPWDGELVPAWQEAAQALKRPVAAAESGGAGELGR